MNNLTSIQTGVGREVDFTNGIALNVNLHDIQEQFISREANKGAIFSLSLLAPFYV
jgi:hypothetical protein